MRPVPGTHLERRLQVISLYKQALAPTTSCLTLIYIPIPAVSIAEGKDEAEALEIASAAGAIAVSRMGAVPSLPHR